MYLFCFGAAETMAQKLSMDDSVKTELFDLLKLKHKFEDVVVVNRNLSDIEFKSQRTAALNNSDYGKASKAIKNNPNRYLTFLERSIKEDSIALSKEYVDWQLVKAYESSSHYKNFITKLFYLKAIKFSFFDQKSDHLLPIHLVPGFKPNSHDFHPALPGG